MKRVSWLNLHEWIAIKDLRKYIYSWLTSFDKMMVLVAHCPKKLTSVQHEYLIPYCAQHGYLELAKWAQDNHFFWNHAAILRRAIGGNRIAVLEWVCQEKGAAANAVACRYAAESGRLELLKWMYANEFDMVGDLWSAAAMGGHVHVFEWLLEIKFYRVLKVGHISTAARNGHLAAVVWLREHGCPWNEEVCIMAAAIGNLHILQWARANGCPWDWHVLAIALDKGHGDVAEWAKANGCPEF